MEIYNVILIISPFSCSSPWCDFFSQEEKNKHISTHPSYKTDQTNNSIKVQLNEAIGLLEQICKGFPTGRGKLEVKRFIVFHHSLSREYEGMRKGQTYSYGKAVIKWTLCFLIKRYQYFITKSLSKSLLSTIQRGES